MRLPALEFTGSLEDMLKEVAVLLSASQEALEGDLCRDIDMGLPYPVILRPEPVEKVAQ
jgi:hypothetical protein